MSSIDNSFWSNIFDNIGISQEPQPTTQINKTIFF
jgi:hypothetical protein